MPDTNVIAVAIFLFAHTGTLIWFLSSINTNLKNVCATLVVIQSNLKSHDDDIDKLDKRISVLEVRCDK